MPSFKNAPVDIVIDVRSRLEFWLGHLPGARNLPVGKLPQSLAQHPEITKGSRILVYCASGARSALAAQLLRADGFDRVVDGGGMAAARTEFRE